MKKKEKLILYFFWNFFFFRNWLSSENWYPKSVLNVWSQLINTQPLYVWFRFLATKDRILSMRYAVVISRIRLHEKCFLWNRARPWRSRVHCPVFFRQKMQRTTGRQFVEQTKLADKPSTARVANSFDEIVEISAGIRFILGVTRPPHYSHSVDGLVIISRSNGEPQAIIVVPVKTDGSCFAALRHQGFNNATRYSAVLPFEYTAGAFFTHIPVNQVWPE